MFRKESVTYKQNFKFPFPMIFHLSAKSAVYIPLEYNVIFPTIEKTGRKPCSINKWKTHVTYQFVISLLLAVILKQTHLVDSQTLGFPLIYKFL